MRKVTGTLLNLLPYIFLNLLILLYFSSCYSVNQMVRKCHSKFKLICLQGTQVNVPDQAEVVCELIIDLKAHIQ